MADFDFYTKVLNKPFYSNEKTESWELFLIIKQKYDQAFITAFDIDEELLGKELKYESITEWDSIGHMALIAELEDSFEISMEMDDIIDFSSYKKGIELLKKYDVEV